MLLTKFQVQCPSTQSTHQNYRPIENIIAPPFSKQVRKSITPASFQPYLSCFKGFPTSLQFLLHQLAFLIDQTILGPLYCIGLLTKRISVSNRFGACWKLSSLRFLTYAFAYKSTPLNHLAKINFLINVSPYSTLYFPLLFFCSDLKKDLYVYDAFGF